MKLNKLSIQTSHTNANKLPMTPKSNDQLKKSIMGSPWQANTIIEALRKCAINRQRALTWPLSSIQPIPATIIPAVQINKLNTKLSCPVSPNSKVPRRKQTTIETPPPRGVERLCELRSLGISRISFFMA